MGWFNRQIKEREENDQKQLHKAYRMLAASIGSQEAPDPDDEHDSALSAICKYFHVETPQIPEKIKDLDEQMEYVFRPAGIMRRRVKLVGAWWKDCFGPLLAEKQSGGICALIPQRPGVYFYTDPKSGKKIRITEASAKEICQEAVCFYRPLPQKPLTKKDLLLFLWNIIPKHDKMYLMVAGIAVTLLGMITPAATAMLLGTVAPSGQEVLVYSFAFLLVGTAVSKFLFATTKTMLRERIEQQLDMTLESAVFARVLSLPVGFFKTYSSGDLSERVAALGTLAPVFCEVVLGSGLTTLFSLGYFAQILSIAPAMAVPSLLMILLQLVVSFLSVRAQTAVTQKKLDTGTKVQGIVFELFSGMQKIKLSGSEKRGFAQWAARYQEEARTNYNPPFILKIQNAISPALALLATIVLYWVAAGASLSASQYVAFNTAYGMVSGAVLSLSSMASMFAVMGPILNIAAPILEAQPETTDEKEMVKSITGAIELNNVSFRYAEDGPMIIDDLSLKIKRGQYIAIVGATGCGKSTLMRLMMGFEKPLTGAVYYDGKDLEKLDQKSLRRQVGVVMQNGKLFSGDIYANIAVSAPGLTLKEAWEAAEMAGMADDIRRMPMGMNTILSEGAGGISGGQKQRLMIARAVAAKPKVLMFDEATSALDNITQRQVSDSLAKMKCTRIVIAHRLSTIKECDRIIVLHQGKIVEDGTYEELNNLGGFFAELVARQQIDIPASLHG